MQPEVTIKENEITLSREEYEALLLKNSELEIEVQFLKHELSKIKRMIYGSRGERFIAATDGQLNLGLEGIEETVPAETITETITYTRNKKTKPEIKGHGRCPLPAHLPRVEHIIEPDCDITGAKKIGAEITETLEYEPGRVFVNKYIRPKYALPEEKGIVIGLLPSLPIPKGNAGASLLSHLMVSKYIDHLPFYRQVQMFKRQDIHIPESTVNDWFRSSCNLLLPLYERLIQRALQCDYLMADETPMAVLTNEKKGATHKGYIWVYYSPVERLACMEYKKGRGREGPKEFLKDFRGALQTDGYQVYDMYENNERIILLACMAHARRKFDEAKSNDKERAEYALTQIQRLYKIEEFARENNFTPEARKAIRDKEATPVLTELEQWLKSQLPHVLPKSPIGVAVSYTLGIWNRLARYLDDGRYEIDNNLVENAIRPIALGRKNYLFAGSHEAAQRAAMMYSFFGSCKRNNVEPFAWLKFVLENIPDTKMSELDRLLPDKWNNSS